MHNSGDKSGSAHRNSSDALSIPVYWSPAYRDISVKRNHWSVGKRKSNANADALLKNILSTLQTSLRVEDGGIEGLQASDSSVAGMSIAGAEQTWRAWKHLGMSTAAMLHSVHSVMGNEDAATNARRELLHKAHDLQVCTGDHQWFLLDRNTG